MNYALITGASKGIGRAIAEELAKRKYDLFLVARSENLLAELSAELSDKYHVKCNYAAADLTTDEGVAKVINDFLLVANRPHNLIFLHTVFYLLSTDQLLHKFVFVLSLLVRILLNQQKK